ncbi:MAG: hypothetical protein WBX35_08470, partial [Pseudolabrys sp.]
MRTIVLLDLIGGRGAAAEGLQMVQNPACFGPELRRFLSTALQNRVAAFKRQGVNKKAMKLLLYVVSFGSVSA